MDRATAATAAAPDTRDNLLGVCAEIGACLSVDPLWIRLGFLIATLAVSFGMTVLAYCVAAVAFRIARR